MESDLRNQIAEIIKNGVTYNHQTGTIIIHGAIDDIVKLIQQDAARSFTEGPWKVETKKEFIKPKTFEIRNHKGLLIANVNIGMSDAEQNANLIASAPDMLAELNDLKQKEGSIDNLWYTEEEMYHQLICENYSEQIAKELSGKWADDLQGAFNKGYEKSVKELTRLRSELQQKDEEINLREAQQDVMAADIVRLLDQIEYQNKTAKEDYDKIKKLEFELAQERELKKELVEALELTVQEIKPLRIKNSMRIMELEFLIKKAK